jgi:hypothetical protein
VEEGLNVKKRFTEVRIIGFLKEAEHRVSVKELCRKRGFSDASFYLRRSKFTDNRPEVYGKRCSAGRIATA